MAKSISVSYSEMESAAARLAAQRVSIEQELQKARRQVQSLVQGGFVTQHASTKFDQASERFVRGATEVMSGLGDLSTYLQQTAKTMQEVDQNLARRIDLQ